MGLKKNSLPQFVNYKKHDNPTSVSPFMKSDMFKAILTKFKIFKTLNPGMLRRMDTENSTRD